MAEKTQVEELLAQIRGLMILAAMRAGATSEDIAKATGMGASTVRRLIPSASLRKTRTSKN